MAAERKKERDRIAQELIETMSQKLGSGTSSSYRYGTSGGGTKAHGISQLPSDDINELMHNTYNKVYLQSKQQRDNYLTQMRKEHYQKQKEIRDTHSNKLKTDIR